MFNLIDKQFDELMKSAKFQALDGIWLSISRLGNDLEFYELVDNNFDLKKTIFFYILEKLIRNGDLLLAKSENDEILYDIPISEQLEWFKQSFPKSERHAQELGVVDVGTWLVVYDKDFCPLRPVWVYTLKNGEKHLEWA